MSLLQTPLHALHIEAGARMVPFAGYDMPVQYTEGILAEHRHTRSAAGLFDVSHMGQVTVAGEGAAAALAALLTADIEIMAPGSQTYALLTNDDGGVRDDLIVTRLASDRFLLVVNAACKDQDVSYLRQSLPGLELTLADDRALLALQGPQARAVLTGLGCDAAANLPFMQHTPARIGAIDIGLSCCGYTGEDGFELSVAADDAAALAGQLLAQGAVQWVGLGARDSLRLEAGLCLYGHELAPDITPIEAGLGWAVGRQRRAGGEREGGFPGASVILEQMQSGTTRRLVGLKVDGRRPIRDGQSVLDAGGSSIGIVSSACVSPMLEQPVGLAFVDTAATAPGTALSVDVRGKAVAVEVCRLPFVPHRYFRGG